MQGGIGIRPASSPAGRHPGRARAARLVLGTFSLLCSITTLSSSPGGVLPLPSLDAGAGRRTALLIARTPLLSLRGGRKADHLPRAFKRALRRHTKSRLISQRSRRLQKRKPEFDQNGTLVRKPRPALLEPVEEEEPEPRWAKAFDQEPPDFSLLLEDWSRGHRFALPPPKGNSNSNGARLVHLIITMIKWIRTSRLSIKNSLPCRPPPAPTHADSPPRLSVGSSARGWLPPD